MIEATEVNSKEDIKPGFREWCICEFMGHLRIIGLVTEQELFGARLLRLDIPGKPMETIDGTSLGISEGHTEYFSGNSIYRLTPVSETVARNLINQGESVRPVTPWEYRQLQQTASEVKSRLESLALVEDESPEDDEDDGYGDEEYEDDYPSDPDLFNEDEL